MTKPRRRQAGEGGISEYATKAGPRYLIKYRAPLDDGTSRVVLRRGFPTRKAAAQALGDVNAELRRGAHVVPSKITTGQWLDQWLAGLRLAESTMASYRKNVRLHVQSHIGAVPLAQLTGARLSVLYRQLEDHGRQDHEAGKGLSARTVRYVATIVKAALREAVEQGLLAVNPADKARPPAARAARPPEIHAWTGQQLAAFLSWAAEKDCQDVAAWHVLAYTGARRGEVLALRWRDLETDAGRLAVRRSLGLVRVKGEGARLIEGPTKSGRERVVDLDPGTVEVLRRHRLARGGLALQLARDDALIFADLEGKPLHPERFSRRFSEQLERCSRTVDLPIIRLHDLRHTHATLMLAAGVPVKVVSERLGHATATITLGIYAHVMPGMQAEAAAKFAALVGG